MSIHDAAITTLSPDASRRLARLGWLGLALAIAWLGFTSPVEDYSIVVLGCVVLFLSAWPALQWAEKLRPWFPVFEISMLTSAPFYAIPVLVGHPEVMPFGDTLTRNAAAIFILFQLAAIGGFRMTRGGAARSSALVEPLLPPGSLRYAPAGMWLFTAYFYVAYFTDLIPYELLGTFRAIFGGIGIASTFLTAFRLGARDLSQAATFSFGLNLVVQILLSFSTLALISGTSLLLLALIGYVAASRHFPAVVVCVGLAAVAFLHNGKSEMRRRYWLEEEHRQPTLTELPAFYAEWIQVAATQREREETGGVQQSQLWERASLFQMLCLVVDRVPEIRPHLDGTSYVDLPALLIPRVFWPNKPSALESNVRLALHFDLVTEDTAANVSIAFGPVAEAYANFGILGVVGYGLVLGMLLKRGVLLAVNAPQFSALGLFMILLTAWSFQVELVVATWVSSLFQATVVIVGLPMALRLVSRRA